MRVRRPADHPFQNGSSTLLDGTGSRPENGTRSKISVALRPRFVPESGPSSLCEPDLKDNYDISLPVNPLNEVPVIYKTDINKM